MDYEKKYKELVEKLTNAYNDNNVNDDRFCCVMDDIIPELAESEYEQIRKKLIEHITLCSESIPERADMLGWLEKQEGCECIRKDWLEHLKQSWYKEGFIDGKYSEKQGEQKQEWSVEEKRIINEMILTFKNARDGQTIGIPIRRSLDWINWLESLRPQKQ